MEIAKIQNLAEKVQDEEKKKEILSAIQTLSDYFDGMLSGVPAFVMEGERRQAHGIDLVKEKLQMLHDIGKEYGVEFPDSSDIRAVKMYIIEFGKEILFS